MATPAMNFVVVCANANIPVSGTKATHLSLRFLKESGVAMLGNPTHVRVDVKERFAMLAWARHAVASFIEPSTWPLMLSSPLLTNLSTLYANPSCADRRLSWRNQPPSICAHGGPLLACRGGHQFHVAAPSRWRRCPCRHRHAVSTRLCSTTDASAAAQAMSAAPTVPLKQVINLAGHNRKRWKMHDELFAELSEDVYTALDANGQLPPEKRSKLQAHAGSQPREHSTTPPRSSCSATKSTSA